MNITVLNGISNATLQQYLTTAQNAYAELMTGRHRVTVSYDGKSVTYQQANLAQLMNWIMMLQAQLGVPGARRRALRPIFT